MEVCLGRLASCIGYITDIVFVGIVESIYNGRLSGPLVLVHWLLELSHVAVSLES